MPVPPVERKLAAIFAADIPGYHRLFLTIALSVRWEACIKINGQSLGPVSDIRWFSKKLVSWIQILNNCDAGASF